MKPKRPVLVVDDSPFVRRVLSRRLAECGLGVREAASVAEGIAVPAGEVACAVLDLELGDGHGVALALALRAADAALPIAFFSGGAEADVLALARAIGPLFSKTEDPDAVVAWAVEAARVRGAKRAR